MKRRDFVKSLTALSIAGSQIPLMAFGRPKHLRTSSGKWNPDRIVIMIKLNGGNDGHEVSRHCSVAELKQRTLRCSGSLCREGPPYVLKTQ